MTENHLSLNFSISTQHSAKSDFIQKMVFRSSKTSVQLCSTVLFEKMDENKYIKFLCNVSCAPQMMKGIRISRDPYSVQRSVVGCTVRERDSAKTNKRGLQRFGN